MANCIGFLEGCGCTYCLRQEKAETELTKKNNSEVFGEAIDKVSK